MVHLFLSFLPGKVIDEILSDQDNLIIAICNHIQSSDMQFIFGTKYYINTSANTVSTLSPLQDCAGMETYHLF